MSEIDRNRIKSILVSVLNELDVPIKPDVEVISPVGEPHAYNVYVTYKVKVSPSDDDIKKLAQTVWQQHTNGQMKLELE